MIKKSIISFFVIIPFSILSKLQTVLKLHAMIVIVFSIYYEKIKGLPVGLYFIAVDLDDLCRLTVILAS